jgi:hypothetical protein
VFAHDSYAVHCAFAEQADDTCWRQSFDPASGNSVDRAQIAHGLSCAGAFGWAAQYVSAQTV